LLGLRYRGHWQSEDGCLASQLVPLAVERWLPGFRTMLTWRFTNREDGEIGNPTVRTAHDHRPRSGLAFCLERLDVQIGRPVEYLAIRLYKYVGNQGTLIQAR